MSIFKKIKEFREAPERKRITVSIGHSIRIKEQGRRESDTNKQISYTVAGGATGLGTEVNSEGDSVANGLRISNNDSVYSVDPALSENAFMPKEKIIDFDKEESCGENGEEALDGASQNACDDSSACANIFGNNECVDCSSESGEGTAKGATRGRVFSQRNTVSFLLCDAIVVGGCIAGVKLLKSIFKM